MNPAHAILLVDDDVELVDMLREYLEQEGFRIAVAHDGATGVAAALTGQHALVVLDVMMPRMSGIEALSRIRAHSAVPVIMLTARGDDVDRIMGLELGADDYVAKPCTPRELAARIRAILRRAQAVDSGEEAARGGAPSPLVVGPLVLWPHQRRAEWQGRALELTSTEFNLLEILARNAGRVVSKQELSELGLGRPLARYDRSIDVHVSSIRQKLDPLPDGRSWIQTVRGMGYLLVLD